MNGFKRFRRWLRFNLKYLGRLPWDTGISPPELRDFIQQAPAGRALDLGCGTGTNLLTLAQQGWKVTGVDLAGLSVRQARTKLRQAGFPARVVRGGVTTAQLGSGYDLALDIGCYHNLTGDERAIYRERLLEWLAPGGSFLLYAHGRRSPESPHGVDERDLTALDAILTRVWQQDTAERRPDGGGGFPSVWVRYDRPPGKG